MRVERCAADAVAHRLLLVALQVLERGVDEHEARGAVYDDDVAAADDV